VYVNYCNRKPQLSSWVYDAAKTVIYCLSGSVSFVFHRGQPTHAVFTHAHTCTVSQLSPGDQLTARQGPVSDGQYGPVCDQQWTATALSVSIEHSARHSAHLVLVVGLRAALWISRAVFPNLAYNWLRHIINGYFHERVFVLFFDWRWFVSFLSSYRYCVCEENARLENVRMKTVSLSI